MAKVGYQASYVSRMLMYANEMFELGARWVIGVMRNRLIFGVIFGCLRNTISKSPPESLLDQSARISELIY